MDAIQYRVHIRLENVKHLPQRGLQSGDARQVGRRVADDGQLRAAGAYISELKV